MTKDKIYALIRDVVCYENLIVSSHCYERMDERNVTDEDIAEVMENGELVKYSWDSDFDNWNCEMTGKDLDGDVLNIEIGLAKDGRSATIITCHDKRFRQ